MDAKAGISMRALAAETKEAVIDVVGEIGWEVSFPVLRDILGRVPDTVERIIFDIYSPGGSVWDGNAIVTLIGGLQQETVARVRVAASMATLLAVACDRREMNANGRWLIHNPWAAAMGDAKEMEKLAKELREAEAEAAEFYAKRTGQKVEAIIDLMDEERWIRAPEAKALGFVHEIINPFDVSEYAAVHKALTDAGKWPVALAELDEETETTTEGGDNVPEADPGTGNDAPAEPSAPTDPADEPEPAADPPPEVPEAPAEKPGGDSGDGDDGDVTPEPVTEKAIADAVRAACADLQADHTVEVSKLSQMLTRTEEARRKLQGELDREKADHGKAVKDLNASFEKRLADVQASLDDANGRLGKLLGGSLKFHPGDVSREEIFERFRGDDYDEARRQYPELYAEYRAQQKQGRK